MARRVVELNLLLRTAECLEMCKMEQWTEKEDVPSADLETHVLSDDEDSIARSSCSAWKKRQPSSSKWHDNGDDDDDDDGGGSGKLSPKQASARTVPGSVASGLSSGASTRGQRNAGAAEKIPSLQQHNTELNSRLLLLDFLFNGRSIRHVASARQPLTGSITSLVAQSNRRHLALQRQRDKPRRHLRNLVIWKRSTDTICNHDLQPRSATLASVVGATLRGKSKHHDDNGGRG
ncbi:DNA repair protein [Pseudozyma hubeiensis SY62]|uniref:DNA repair protein n=1 Tax=Pseudozyma hubeiensis (strain SY62) TaxID=1305764 RepID=R9P2R7_PSEHS|nr:DNA repair protein [Pseudozyma hubeiensis SY62]GAC95631.1 DNA repair protein [Pseudozyma hubeiensis SY62]